VNNRGLPLADIKKVSKRSAYINSNFQAHAFLSTGLQDKQDLKFNYYMHLAYVCIQE